MCSYHTFRRIWLKPSNFLRIAHEWALSPTMAAGWCTQHRQRDNDSQTVKYTMPLARMKHRCAASMQSPYLAAQASMLNEGRLSAGHECVSGPPPEELTVPWTCGRCAAGSQTWCLFCRALQLKGVDKHGWIEDLLGCWNKNYMNQIKHIVPKNEWKADKCLFKVLCRLSWTKQLKSCPCRSSCNARWTLKWCLGKYESTP